MLGILWAGGQVMGQDRYQCAGILMLITPAPLHALYQPPPCLMASVLAYLNLPF